MRPIIDEELLGELQREVSGACSSTIHRPFLKQQDGRPSSDIGTPTRTTPANLQQGGTATARARASPSAVRACAAQRARARQLRAGQNPQNRAPRRAPRPPGRRAGRDTRGSGAARLRARFAARQRHQPRGRTPRRSPTQLFGKIVGDLGELMRPRPRSAGRTVYYCSPDVVKTLRRASCSGRAASWEPRRSTLRARGRQGSSRSRRQVRAGRAGRAPRSPTVTRAQGARSCSIGWTRQPRPPVASWRASPAPAVASTLRMAPCGQGRGGGRPPRAGRASPVPRAAAWMRHERALSETRARLSPSACRGRPLRRRRVAGYLTMGRLFSAATAEGAELHKRTAVQVAVACATAGLVPLVSDGADPRPIRRPGRRQAFPGAARVAHPGGSRARTARRDLATGARARPRPRATSTCAGARERRACSRRHRQ